MTHYSCTGEPRLTPLNQTNYALAFLRLITSIALLARIQGGNCFPAVFHPSSSAKAFQITTLRLSIPVGRTCNCLNASCVSSRSMTLLSYRCPFWLCTSPCQKRLIPILLSAERAQGGLPGSNGTCHGFRSVWRSQVDYSEP